MKGRRAGKQMALVAALTTVIEEAGFDVRIHDPLTILGRAELTETPAYPLVEKSENWRRNGKRRAPKQR